MGFAFPEMGMETNLQVYHAGFIATTTEIVRKGFCVRFGRGEYLVVPPTGDRRIGQKAERTCFMHEQAAVFHALKFDLSFSLEEIPFPECQILDRRLKDQENSKWGAYR